MNWTSIDEQLPNDLTDILLCSPRAHYVVVGQLDNGRLNCHAGSFDPKGGFITHWMPIPKIPKIFVGDYVLATAWPDGSVYDPFAIGFISKIDDERFFVADSEGNDIFPNKSFRTAKRISQECGKYILDNVRDVEQSGGCLWDVVKWFEKSD